MANFCTNCGAKLRKEDNFCSNCGTKIDKSDIPHNNHLLKSSNSIEKEKAEKELKRMVGGKLFYNKNFSNALIENGLDIANTGKSIRQQVEKEIASGQIKSGGVEYRVNQLIHEYKIRNEKEKIRIAKEKEEEQKKLKKIDEIFESAEIKVEIINNKIDQADVISIKDNLKNKIINKKEDMSEEEIKNFIKTKIKKVAREQKKIRIAKEKEMNRKKIEENEMIYGNYCSLSCKHCYEEFIDGGGAIVGDFDSEGYVEYYCHLGHTIAYGSFCEDFER